MTNVQWLVAGPVGDDTHGHIDDICRFVNRKTVVLIRETNRKDINHRPLAENWERIQDVRLEDGSKPEVVPLPMPAPIYFDGYRLPASYANFYIANAAVIVPTFNDPNDRVPWHSGGPVCRPAGVGIHAVTWCSASAACTVSPSSNRPETSPQDRPGARQAVGQAAAPVGALDSPSHSHHSAPAGPREQDTAPSPAASPDATGRPSPAGRNLVRPGVRRHSPSSASGGRPRSVRAGADGRRNQRHRCPAQLPPVAGTTPCHPACGRTQPQGRRAGRGRNRPGAGHPPGGHRGNPRTSARPRVGSHSGFQPPPAGHCRCIRHGGLPGHVAHGLFPVARRGPPGGVRRRPDPGRPRGTSPAAGRLGSRRNSPNCSSRDRLAWMRTNPKPR